MSNHTYPIPPHFSLFQDSLDYVGREAKNDLEQLRGKHIFLTGCTSFFGKWLIECLLWADRSLRLDLSLTVLTRNATRFLHSMPHFAGHTTLTLLEGAAESLTPDKLSPFQYAIHAVNLLNDESSAWPARHMRTAVLSTNNVMRLAGEHGCGTVLLVSSGGAYGVQKTQHSPFSEDGMPVTMDEPTIYGNTKRFLELFTRGLGQEKGIQTPVARLFTFSGPYTPLIPRLALGSFMFQALRDEPVVIKSDGTALRSYLDARDMVVWTLGVLLRGGNKEYNIGSASPISIRDLASEVLRAAGRPATDLHVQGISMPGNAPNVYIPQTSLAASLGLRETINLHDSLADMVCWHRQLS